MESRRQSFCMEILEGRQLLSYAVTDVLINNGFGDSGVSAHVWSIPQSGYPLGRTEFRSSQDSGLPVVRRGAIRLTLDTYSRDGLLTTGDQLTSNQSFTVGTGLDVKFRARINEPASGGMVGGLFLYDSTINAHGKNDEVDYEILSNDLVNGENEIQTNIFAHEPEEYGKSAVVAFPKRDKLPGYHDYELTVLPGEVDWRVDGKIVRVEREDVPKGPFQVNMSLWAADSGWTDAYDSRLRPTSSRRRNREYSMDIKSVVVSRIKPT